MKAIAQIETDGQLIIAADVIREAGFSPGDRVELLDAGQGLLVAPEKNVDNIFARWAGIDKSRPPMSMAEIIAEQREMRGHDDLD